MQNQPLAPQAQTQPGAQGLPTQYYDFFNTFAQPATAGGNSGAGVPGASSALQGASGTSATGQQPAQEQYNDYGLLSSILPQGTGSGQGRAQTGAASSSGAGLGQNFFQGYDSAGLGGFNGGTGGATGSTQGGQNSQQAALAQLMMGGNGVLPGGIMPQGSGGFGLGVQNPLIQPNSLQGNPLAQIMGMLAPAQNPFSNQMGSLMALAQLLGAGGTLPLGQGGNLPTTPNQGSVSGNQPQGSSSGGNGSSSQQRNNDDHQSSGNQSGTPIFSKFFVGGISYSAKESDIQNYFGQFGHVVDVAIMRDKSSGKSRGFAFVTFREYSREAAQKIEKSLLNPRTPHSIQNRTIDVRQSDGSKPPDSFLDKQGANNNSAGGGSSANVSSGGNNGGGSSSSANRGRDGNNKRGNERDGGRGGRDGGMRDKSRGGDGGNSRMGGGNDRDKKSSMRNFPSEGGSGSEAGRFNPEDQKKSLGGGNFKNDKMGRNDSGSGNNMLGKRKDNGDFSSGPTAAKVFVGGLDYNLTEDDFRKHFEDKFGIVKAAQIVRDANTGQSKGFGFVTFQKESVAKELIERVRVTNINGRKVDLRTADPKDQSKQNQRQKNDGGNGGGSQGNSNSQNRSDGGMRNQGQSNQQNRDQSGRQGMQHGGANILPGGMNMMGGGSQNPRSQGLDNMNNGGQIHNLSMGPPQMGMGMPLSRTQSDFSQNPPQQIGGSNSNQRYPQQQPHGMNMGNLGQSRSHDNQSQSRGNDRNSGRDHNMGSGSTSNSRDGMDNRQQRDHHDRGGNRGADNHQRGGDQGRQNFMGSVPSSNQLQGTNSGSAADHHRGGSGSGRGGSNGGYGGGDQGRLGGRDSSGGNHHSGNQGGNKDQEKKRDRKFNDKRDDLKVGSDSGAGIGSLGGNSSNVGGGNSGSSRYDKPPSNGNGGGSGRDSHHGGSGGGYPSSSRTGGSGSGTGGPGGAGAHSGSSIRDLGVSSSQQQYSSGGLRHSSSSGVQGGSSNPTGVGHLHSSHHSSSGAVLGVGPGAGGSSISAMYPPSSSVQSNAFSVGASQVGAGQSSNPGSQIVGPSSSNNSA